MPQKSPQHLPDTDIIRALREVTDNNGDLIIVDATVTPEGVVTLVKYDTDNNILLDLSGVFKRVGADPGETVDPGNEDTAGKLRISTLPEALEATDDTTALSPRKGLALIGAELNDRGLVAAILNDVAARQTQAPNPFIDQPIKSLAQILARTLAMTNPGEITDLEKLTAKAVWWTATGDLKVSDLSQAIPGGQFALAGAYDQNTHALTLTPTGATGDVTYSIAEMNVADSVSATYTVPAELRSGNVILHITAKTATQTGTATAAIPADPLGNQYITAFYVARNIGKDGVNSLSFYVKGKAEPAQMRMKLVGRNGTLVPAGVSDVFRYMTTQDGGYSRVGLFTSTAKYGSLYSGIDNGDYTGTVEVEGAGISLTLNFSISDAQPQLVLYQSTITPPESRPTAPTVNAVIITTGTYFEIQFPKFNDEPDGTVGGLNYRPNGTEFNATTRVLSGTVPQYNTADVPSVQYYVTTPGGQVVATLFHMQVIDPPVTPAPAVATVVYVDEEQIITGNTNGVPQYSQNYYFKISDGSAAQYRLQLQATGYNFSNWLNQSAYSDGGYSGRGSFINTGGLGVKIEVRPASNPSAVVQITIAAYTGVVARRPIFSVLNSGDTGSASLTSLLGPPRAYQGVLSPTSVSSHPSFSNIAIRNWDPVKKIGQPYETANPGAPPSGQFDFWDVGGAFFLDGNNLPYQRAGHSRLIKRYRTSGNPSDRNSWKDQTHLSIPPAEQPVTII